MTGIVLLVLLACGSERVAVKNLTDKDAGRVSQHAVGFTVEQLTHLAPPPKWTPKLLRQPTERQLVTVEAEVAGFKLEADGDFHVVLIGESGATMIAEFPDIVCVAHALRSLRDRMAAAREAFTLHFGVVEKRFKALDTPVKVRVTGVIHFDRLHGQQGVAPNGIELHPVIALEMLP